MEQSLAIPRQTVIDFDAKSVVMTPEWEASFPEATAAFQEADRAFLDDPESAS